MPNPGPGKNYTLKIGRFQFIRSAKDKSLWVVPGGTFKTYKEMEELALRMGKPLEWIPE